MNFVFFGDSITDAGRNTDSGCPEAIVQGYVMLLAARLGADAWLNTFDSFYGSLKV